MNFKEIPVFLSDFDQGLVAQRLSKYTTPKMQVSIVFQHCGLGVCTFSAGPVFRDKIVKSRWSSSRALVVVVRGCVTLDQLLGQGPLAFVHPN